MKRHNRIREATNYTIVPKEVDAKNRSVEQQIEDLKGKVDNDNGDSVEVDEKNFESKVYTKKRIMEIRLKNLMERSKIYSKRDLVENKFYLNEDDEQIPVRKRIKYRRNEYNHPDNFTDEERAEYEKVTAKYYGSPFIDFFVYLRDPLFRSSSRTTRVLDKLIRQHSPYLVENGRFVKDENGEKILVLDDDGEPLRVNGGFDDVDVLHDMTLDPYFMKDTAWQFDMVTQLNKIVKNYVITRENLEEVNNIYGEISMRGSDGAKEKAASFRAGRYDKNITAVRFNKDGSIDKRFNLNVANKPYNQPLAVTLLNDVYEDRKIVNINKNIAQMLNNFIETGNVDMKVATRISEEIDSTFDKTQSFNNQKVLMSPNYLYMFGLLIGDENYLDLSLKNTKFGLVTNQILRLLRVKNFPEQSYDRLIDDIEDNRFKRNYNNLKRTFHDAFIQGKTGHYEKNIGVDPNKGDDNPNKGNGGKPSNDDGGNTDVVENRLNRIISQIISENNFNNKKRK